MKIAVLPRDGIGPEIVTQAGAVRPARGLAMQLENAPFGGAA